MLKNVVDGVEKLILVSLAANPLFIAETVSFLFKDYISHLPAGDVISQKA